MTRFGAQIVTSEDFVLDQVSLMGISEPRGKTVISLAVLSVRQYCQLLFCDDSNDNLPGRRPCPALRSGGETRCRLLL